MRPPTVASTPVPAADGADVKAETRKSRCPACVPCRNASTLPYGPVTDTVTGTAAKFVLVISEFVTGGTPAVGAGVGAGVGAAVADGDGDAAGAAAATGVRKAGRLSPSS